MAKCVPLRLGEPSRTRADSRPEEPGGASVTDGRPADPVAGVEVEPVVGGDVVVRACHNALLHVDVESVVLEHSAHCNLSRKLIRIWIEHLLEVRRGHRLVTRGDTRAISHQALVKEK